MKWVDRLWHSWAWRSSLALFLLFRFGIWGWMVLVRQFIPAANSFGERAHPYLGISPEKNVLLEVWQRWDVLHYQQIAINGYHAASIEPFGPLYPFLMRWISPLTGGNTLLAGLLISRLFCWLAFKLLFWSIFDSLDSGFQRHFSFPGLNLWYSIRNIARGVHPLVNLPDLIFMLLLLAGTVLVWKKLPLIYTIYTCAFLALYRSTTTSPYPLLSISRYVLVMFPMFFVVPTLLKKNGSFLATLAIIFDGLLFYSAQFALWGWVG